MYCAIGAIVQFFAVVNPEIIKDVSIELFDIWTTLVWQKCGSEKARYNSRCFVNVMVYILREAAVGGIASGLTSSGHGKSQSVNLLKK